jgi:23S rRNA G2069 N7-methylase RlmK/C1962 C5-methylase RlmI
MQRTFSVERDQGWLLERCRDLLRPGGTLWFSTNCHGFQLAGIPAGLAGDELTARTVPEDCARRPPHRCWRLERRG